MCLLIKAAIRTHVLRTLHEHRLAIDAFLVPRRRCRTSVVFLLDVPVNLLVLAALSFTYVVAGASYCRLKSINCCPSIIVKLLCIRLHTYVVYSTDAERLVCTSWASPTIDDPSASRFS